ncbi:hypothetical protein EDM57_04930 [Brevibacillus gelatini]|uniref:Uncharacterized protein n=1 Tax=Brevibacillus gelatini TaxID=1655277 RepID=A0A3M8B7T8_9BACL|nr:hypothetical protein [Brevibacillus gelatini]RNB59488.1 hypothetical protein EDM57_04930 [Brevibacillus gelatini]
MEQLMTKQMVDEFNQLLIEKGSIIRLVLVKENEIQVKNVFHDPFVDNKIWVHVNEKFIQMLESFLKDKGITKQLCYYMPGNHFWINNF